MSLFHSKDPDMQRVWRISFNPHALWRLFWDSAKAWNDVTASRKGAALAYYTVFSLAPILIIAIAIAGLFFGQDAARGEIVSQISGLIGQDGARAVQTLIEHASKPGAGISATIIGVATLLLGATSALAELKSDLDEIWGVPPHRRSGLWYIVRTRLLSFGLILSLGFLLLVSLVLSALLAALAKFWSGNDATSVMLQIVNFLVSFGLVTTLFAMIYKLLPSFKIAWHDVIIGAVVTAMLFNIGKFLIGFYLGSSAIASSYGAAGSIILLLVWIYYSTQIFLFGAEFTRVYAYRYGSYKGKPLPQPSLTEAPKPKNVV
jgi:membrane protein